MICADLSGINSCIEAAEKLSHGIIRDGGSGKTVENASKLDELLKDIQAYLVAIQSEYIRLSRDKDALEQELLKARKMAQKPGGPCQCDCRQHRHARRQIPSPDFRPAGPLDAGPAASFYLKMAQERKKQ